MRSDWIIDVLTDLKTFARANSMPALAEQLDDTTIVAMAEIAAIRNENDNQSINDNVAVGTYHGGTRTS